MKRNKGISGESKTRREWLSKKRPDPDKIGTDSGQQALEKIQFEGTIAQKLEAISRVASCSTRIRIG